MLGRLLFLIAMIRETNMLIAINQSKRVRAAY